jgi:hypothetical protein
VFPRVGLRRSSEWKQDAAEKEVLLYLIDFDLRAIDRAATGVENFDHGILFPVKLDIALCLGQVGLQKENEKLLKQTLDLKSAIAENATPLKTKARILAQQLLAFSKVQPQNQMKMMDDWGNRFEPRLYEIIKRLDELGQHSDLLNSSVMVGMPPPPAALQTMARELESLAGNLKE